MFTTEDKSQIHQLGLTLEKVERQLKNFREGFPFLNIQKEATIGSGIFKMSEEEVDKYSKCYDQNKQGLKVLKFVPASGAASRMFKDLFAFNNDYNSKIHKYDGFLEFNGLQKVDQILKELGSFAFYADLKEVMARDDENLETDIIKGEFKKITDYILREKGLNYGNKPKGLLVFHAYDEELRTAAEEHMAEAVMYAANSDDHVHLHFTVSPEHQADFERHLNALKAKYEVDNLKFNISYSEQKKSTDVIAANRDHTPFRMEDGSLLFRPGGHGALIENLNDLDADIIFIKNIDNVVPDHYKEETVRYKKALAGVLLDVQERIFSYLKQLDEAPSAELFAEIEKFLEEEMCLLLPAAYKIKTLGEKCIVLQEKLNRPLRVCGMVKNEGEPGGGPFWVGNNDGSVALQIVETAQIDTTDPAKAKILNRSSHFNPVDLICATKDYKGEKFELGRFVDPATGFISTKSRGGKAVMSQELPGLWNGAMSDWNTIFVEVPIITFNPVKTVNDLLREEHQPHAHPAE